MDLGPIESRIKASFKQQFKQSIYCKLEHLNPREPLEKQRGDLRKVLVKALEKESKKSLPQEEKDTLLDLNKQPKSTFTSLALSHCPTLGGIVFCFNKKIALGFDVERTSRVTHKTIKRISEQKELSLAPQPSLLWVAKEAAFKAVPNKNLFLRHCIISQWKEREDTYRFCFYANTYKGQGSAFFCNNGAISLAYASRET